MSVYKFQLQLACNLNIQGPDGVQLFGGEYGQLSRRKQNIIHAFVLSTKFQDRLVESLRQPAVLDSIGILNIPESMREPVVHVDNLLCIEVCLRYGRLSNHQDDLSVFACGVTDLSKTCSIEMVVVDIITLNNS